MTASKASPSSAKRGAFQPTKRHVGNTHSRNKHGVLAALNRERMLHPAPGKAVKVMQLVWDMFETALDLGDDADRYRLFDTAHTLAAVYLLPDWLGAKPIVKYHDLQPLPHQYVPARY